MEPQLVELLGRNRLTDELLRAGLEIARPLRDRGIDLIAYADLESKVSTFRARPIQMKAASSSSFGLNQKYAKFPNLLIAFVWHLDEPTKAVTYALTYREAVAVADAMGYTQTPSWRTGSYDTTRPGKKLQQLLEPYQMIGERWWKRVVEGE
jgi:hypothetical protein